VSHEHEVGSESCRELFSRLSEYVDGELDPEICAGIENHMEGCAPCEAFVESLRRTIELTQRLPAHELPDEMIRDLVEAYNKARATRDFNKPDLP